MPGQSQKPLHIPQTSSWVTWPMRTTGVVPVESFLCLPTGQPRQGHLVSPVLPTLRRLLRQTKAIKPAGSPASIAHVIGLPMELSFRREHLARLLRAAPADSRATHLENWARMITLTLAYYASNSVSSDTPGRAQFLLVPDPRESRHRWHIQRLKGEYPGIPSSGLGGWRPRHSIPYTIKIPRVTLQALVPVLASDRGFKEVLFAVGWNLLPTIFVGWALRGRPRGPRVRAQFLMPVARMALCMALRLTEQAQHGVALRRRIEGVLRPEGFESNHWQRPDGRRDAALLLTDRTLKPAWKACGVRSLNERQEQGGPRSSRTSVMPSSAEP